MKTSFSTLLLTISVALRVNASYPNVAEGALNVRHFHVIERGEDGQIAARSFLNTFEIERRNEEGDLERRRCTTINACGTAGGCAVMAGQRYCDGVPWQKSFQDAVKQTGANGLKALQLIGESAGRGPVGTLAGMAETTAKEIKKAEKGKKKGKKEGKKKRGFFDGEDIILNARDFEFVERDGGFNLVQRGELSFYDLVTRDDEGTVIVRECQAYNGESSCL